MSASWEPHLLATVSTIRHQDGLISTNPVGFDWDGEFVRLSTLKSRVKYRNLAGQSADHLLRGRSADADALHRDPGLRPDFIDDPEGAMNRKMFRSHGAAGNSISTSREPNA